MTKTRVYTIHDDDYLLSYLSISYFLTFGKRVALAEVVEGR